MEFFASWTLEGKLYKWYGKWVVLILDKVNYSFVCHSYWENFSFFLSFNIINSVDLGETGRRVRRDKQHETEALRAIESDCISIATRFSSHTFVIRIEYYLWGFGGTCFTSLKLYIYIYICVWSGVTCTLFVACYVGKLLDFRAARFGLWGRKRNVRSTQSKLYKLSWNVHVDWLRSDFLISFSSSLTFHKKKKKCRNISSFFCSHRLFKQKDFDWIIESIKRNAYVCLSDSITLANWRHYPRSSTRKLWMKSCHEILRVNELAMVIARL